jgi:signal peptidase II
MAARAMTGMRIATLTTALTLAVDQVTKVLVVHGLDLVQRGEIDVLPPFLNFRMGWNYGINFGLFTGQSEFTRWLLIAVALAISLWVWLWVRRSAPSVRAQAAAGLLVGGALGNVIDRLAYGAVADFLNMSCCGIENPFTFNVADIAIFAGALGLALFAAPKDAGKPPRSGKPGRKTP